MISEKLIEMIKHDAIDQGYQYCNISNANTEYENKKIIKSYLSKLNCIGCLSNAIEFAQNETDIAGLFAIDNNTFNNYSPLIIPETPLHVSKIASVLSEYIYNHNYKFVLNNNYYSANKKTFKKQIINSKTMEDIKTLKPSLDFVCENLLIKYRENYLSEHCEEIDNENNAGEIDNYILMNTCFSIIKDSVEDFGSALYGHFFEAIIYLIALKYKNDYETYKNNYIETVKERLENNNILINNNCSSYSEYEIMNLNNNSLTYYKDILDIFLMKSLDNYKSEPKKLDMLFVVCYSLYKVIEELETKNDNNEDNARKIFFMLKQIIYSDEYFKNQEIKINDSSLLESIYIYSFTYLFHYFERSINNIETLTDSVLINVEKKINLTSHFIHAEADFIFSFRNNENDKIYYYIVDAKCYQSVRENNLLSFLLQVIGYKHQINILNNKSSFRNKYNFDKKEFGGFLIINPFDTYEKYNLYYNLNKCEQYEDIYEDYIEVLTNNINKV